MTLPEVTDPRIQQARRQLEQEHLAEIIWVEQPADHPRFDEVAAHILARRQHKGMTPDESRARAREPLFFAASLVALGHADASVAGAVAPTPDVIRAGLHCVGLAPERAVVSSMFLMVRDGEALSYADAGVLPDPSADELVDVAAVTAEHHRLFTGDEPRVAFLSFSTKGSASHPRVDKMRDAAAAFAASHPDIVSDGELQFDAAYVPEVAATKAPGSPLAGGANVFVFPDLDAANIAYKITQRLAGFAAFGPLTQGLARPCLDLSRGCTADDVVNVAVLAALMASR